MDLRIFLLFEVKGLASTIDEYTRNHYVRNYTNLLIKFSKKSDFDNLELVINKLLEWYQVEILKMRSNKYLYNLEVHEKSLSLLKEAKVDLMTKNKKDQEA